MPDYLIVLLMLAASATDLANERFEVSGKDLEAHWRVDCTALVQHYRQITGSTPTPIESRALQELLADAEKCAIIYNTKNTGRTVECPDYHQIMVSLGQFQEGSLDAPAALDCELPTP